MINDHTALRVDSMPFVGLKESGLGVGGIPYTIRDMTVEKLIVLRSRAEVNAPLLIGAVELVACCADGACR